MALGENGDLTADTGFTMPANWPTTGEVAPTDAQLHQRVRVRVVCLTDCGVGAGAAVAFSIEEASAPWQKVIRMNGLPSAAVTLRVEVEYIHSLVR
jgi:hypothetical protein